MDKYVLITIIKGLQLQLNTITSQLEFLTEQIALMNSVPSVVKPNRQIRCNKRLSIIPQTFLVDEHHVQLDDAHRRNPPEHPL